MMKQRKSALQLGIFVIGSLLLFVLFLLTLGGQNLFTKQVPFTLYFDRSVKGLNQGAPVMFRGVRVGQVNVIQFARQMKKRHGVSWPIEVTIALDPASLDIGKDDDYSTSSFIDTTARNGILLFHGSRMVKEWVFTMVSEHAMCARLQTLSLLTGQLYVELDFFPEYPPSQNDLKKLKDGVIPSRISALDRISQNLKQRERTEALNVAITTLSDFVLSGHAKQILEDVHAVAQNAKSITSDTRELMTRVNSSSPQAILNILSIMGQANQVLVGTNQLLGTLNKQTPELLGKANTTFDQANATIQELTPKVEAILASANQLCERLNQDADLENGPGAPLLKESEALLQQMQRSFAELEATIKEVQTTLQPNSQERIAIQGFIEQLNRAASAIRVMADTIERNPASLLWGK